MNFGHYSIDINDSDIQINLIGDIQEELKEEKDFVLIYDEYLRRVKPVNDFIINNVKSLLLSTIKHFDLKLSKNYTLDINNSPYVKSDFKFHSEQNDCILFPNWTFNSYISNNEIKYYEDLYDIKNTDWNFDTIYWRGLKFDNYYENKIPIENILNILEIGRKSFISGLRTDICVNLLNKQYDVSYQEVFDLDINKLKSNRFLFDTYTASNIGSSYLKILLFTKRPILYFNSPLKEFFTDQLEDKKHFYKVNSIQDISTALEEIKENKYMENMLCEESFDFALKKFNKHSIYSYIKDKCLI